MGPVFDSLKGDRKKKTQEPRSTHTCSWQQGRVGSQLSTPAWPVLSFPSHSPEHCFGPLQSINSHTFLLTCNAGPFKIFEVSVPFFRGRGKTNQPCGKTGISLMGSRCLHSADFSSWLTKQGRERLCPNSSQLWRYQPSIYPHPTAQHLTPILPPSTSTALPPALTSRQNGFSSLRKAVRAQEN